MAYFDYISNCLAADNIQDFDAIRGTCETFCPQEETTMRQKEKMVHVLEVLGSERTLVKSYSRSAADSNMAKPHMLRPYPVLKKTLEHLLLDVIRRSDVPSAVMYDFLNDRLRAVRQDMTIQRLEPDKCTELLEPMVRFYVYFGYKLCDASVNEFDPVLNKKYLLECLKLYLTYSDQIHQEQYLGDLFANLKLNKTHELSNNRLLMESLNILCNLDDVHPLMRFLSLDKELRRKPLLQTSYKIAIAIMMGGFVQATRLASELCPLSFYAFCIHLPELQRRSLQTLSHAYHSNQLTIPLSAVKAWLMFDSERQAKEACIYYGLTVEGDKVRFQKNSFKMESLLKMKHIGSEKHHLPVAEILTYKSYD